MPGLIHACAMGSAVAARSMQIALEGRRTETRARWRPFLRNKGAIVGCAVILVLICAAVLAPILAPFSPYATSATEKLQPPNQRHWLGTDSLGRDMLSRVMYGARISLGVGFSAVIVSLVLGTSLGVIGGYLGGWLDDLIMRLNDVLMAIPGIVLALAIVASTGPTVWGVVLAIAISGAPGDARLARSQTLYERTLDYVTAAQTIGCRQSRIIRVHILPNISSVIIVRATTNLGAAILTAAGLSFLGLGVPPPTPTWGAMVSDGRQYIFTAAYLGVIPGLFIMITVLAFNVAGDGLRDALDPRSRKRVGR